MHVCGWESMSAQMYGRGWYEGRTAIQKGFVWLLHKQLRILGWPSTSLADKLSPTRWLELETIAARWVKEKVDFIYFGQAESEAKKKKKKKDQHQMNIIFHLFANLSVDIGIENI